MNLELCGLKLSKFNLIGFSDFNSFLIFDSFNNTSMIFLCLFLRFVMLFNSWFLQFFLILSANFSVESFLFRFNDLFIFAIKSFVDKLSSIIKSFIMSSYPLLRLVFDLIYCRLICW